MWITHYLPYHHEYLTVYLITMVKAKKNGQVGYICTNKLDYAKNVQ